MVDTANIDRLILYERKAAAFQWRCFYLIAAVFLVLLALNLSMGWITNVGSALGNLLTGVLSYLPLAQISKRKDHIAALDLLKEALTQPGAHGDDLSKVESMVMTRIQKMLEG